jgi:signal transduction histidine kinase
LFDAIEQVMSIQANTGMQQNVELKVVYKNISNHGNEGNLKDYSPLIYTDEQRMMQVLLALQSNALKFTKNGSVTIYAEI